MTTLNITYEGVCTGGGHPRIGVRVNAGQKRIVEMTLDQIESALDDDGKVRLLASILKLYSLGKTRQQVRAGLQAGIQVVI